MKPNTPVRSLKINSMRGKRSAVASLSVLAFTLTGCSGSSSVQANLPLVQSVCITVTSAYDRWMIVGEDSDSELGSLGRTHLMDSITLSLGELLDVVPQSDLELAREASDKSVDFTAADVAVGLQNLQNYILNWEALFEEPWTPGKALDIDGIYSNAVEKRCGALAGTQESTDRGLELESRDTIEDQAKSYGDIGQLIAAFEEAGGDCSMETIQNDGSRDYAAFCSDPKEAAISTLFIGDSTENYEYSRPEELSEFYWEIYGPNWSILVPKTLEIDPEDVAIAMGGILFKG